MANKAMMMIRLYISPLMKPGNRFYFLVVALFILLLPLQAQQRDFQCWPSAQVSLEVLNNLKVHLEEELRLVENASQFGRQINDIGASYRFNKYLRASLFYRIEADWKNADTYRWRQGAFADVSMKYDVARFTFGYRIRFQSARVEFNEGEPLLRGFVNRHKLSAAYDIKGLPIIPFIEEEAFINLTGNSEIKAYRTWIGLSWAPGKIHELSLKYGIEKQRGIADPLTSYILAIQYAASLSMK